MPRMHVHTIGGIALVLGAIIFLVAQGVFAPALSRDPAEQLTAIARTAAWGEVQRASLAALPLMLMGLLAGAARVVSSGARSWGWLGGGFALFGMSALALPLFFFAGSAESTRLLVSENAPIDAMLLSAYDLILPTALVAQTTGWFALGLGVALLGRGVHAAGLSATWAANTVSALGVLGAVFTWMKEGSSAVPLASAAILAGMLILAATLIVMPAESTDGAA
jgi:hypothetical protein